VVLCVTYSLLFIVAFSAIGNFGIIARQRSLVYPFIIVLLALPAGRIDPRSPLKPDQFASALSSASVRRTT
jgi:hypothetical protein